jgi:hypothetical protein
MPKAITPSSYLTELQITKYLKDFEEVLKILRIASEDLADIRKQMRESSQNTTH